MSENNTEVLHVVHNEGEEKPWEIKFDDVGGLKHARAILNYPVHKFETEEKAIEVAEMLRDIIHADGVVVENESGVRDSEPAEFFHPVQSEDTADTASSERDEDLEEWHANEPVKVDELNPRTAGVPVSEEPVRVAPPEHVSQPATPARF